ncbi:CAP domain-containing protein [Streptomyces flavalbus]|uniref:CAP domain-containing protein n=1 Tax=Streptomyces flavalbus TaxID=2665155 RepID=A0ABW2WG16_9ACTN
MGRHRRIAAGRAATGRAGEVAPPHGSSTREYDPRDPHAAEYGTTGIAPYLHPEAYADARARSEAYLYAPDAYMTDGGGYPAAAETVGFPADGYRAGGFPAGGRRVGGPAPDRFTTEALASHDFATGDHLSSDRPSADYRPHGFPADDRLSHDFSVDDRLSHDFATDDFTAADGLTTTAFASDGFTPDEGARRAGTHRRRKKKAGAPVRNGLLGVSAAVALGTVAVATGVIPGTENYQLGGGGGDKVQSADTPGNSATQQGGASGSAEYPEGTATSPGGQRSGTGSASSGASDSAKPSPSTSSAAPTEAPAKEKEPQANPSKTKQPKPVTPPSNAATQAPEESSAPVTVSREAAAEAEVLKLVNQERAQAGCSPVAANSALASLAGAFSADMAARDFFDHTDPSGATPWDRAEAAGIDNLGGENIARGQADAAAVMDAWMNSPGHRANILNCDFTTLGVGVHFGDGGPWWTQNFGY